MADLIKGIISFAIKAALVVGIGTVAWKQMYLETRKTALTAVYNSLHSKNNLVTYTEKLTGRKNWINTPLPKKPIIQRMIENIERDRRNRNQ